jgi:hypothetical protein
VDVYYGESEEATLVPLSALYENPSTGATGVYVSKTSLGDVQPGGAMNDGEAVTLTAPVAFDFVPVEVIAKGRMRAGIRDVEPGSWVITIGQDLLGGAAGNARVRPVHWEWVEQLQHLQRQDLLQEIMRRQRAAGEDTAIIELEKPSTE